MFVGSAQCRIWAAQFSLPIWGPRQCCFRLWVIGNSDDLSESFLCFPFQDDANSFIFFAWWSLTFDLVTCQCTCSIFLKQVLSHLAGRTDSIFMFHAPAFRIVDNYGEDIDDVDYDDLHMGQSFAN